MHPENCTSTGNKHKVLVNDFQYSEHDSILKEIGNVTKLY
jgi:hypothetical protein